MANCTKRAAHRAVRVSLRGRGANDWPTCCRVHLSRPELCTKVDLCNGHDDCPSHSVAERGSPAQPGVIDRRQSPLRSESVQTPEHQNGKGAWHRLRRDPRGCAGDLLDQALRWSCWFPPRRGLGCGDGNDRADHGGEPQSVAIRSRSSRTAHFLPSRRVHARALYESRSLSGARRLPPTFLRDVQPQHHGRGLRGRAGGRQAPRSRLLARGGGGDWLRIDLRQRTRRCFRWVACHLRFEGPEHGTAFRARRRRAATPSPTGRVTVDRRPNHLYPRGDSHLPEPAPTPCRRPSARTERAIGMASASS